MVTNIEGVKIGQRFRCVNRFDKHVYERVEPMSYAEAWYLYDYEPPSWVFMRSKRVLTSGELGGYYLCRPEIQLEIVG